MRKNRGKEELRARDLFYALWIPDLFMERVEQNALWSLFCPHECPGLSDVYGKEFEALYEKYEQEGRFKRQVRAQELWFAILESQSETGTPYMLYKVCICSLGCVRMFMVRGMLGRLQSKIEPEKSRDNTMQQSVYRNRGVHISR
jgi:hypothetical protein